MVTSVTIFAFPLFPHLLFHHFLTFTILEISKFMTLGIYKPIITGLQTVPCDMNISHTDIAMMMMIMLLMMMIYWQYIVPGVKVHLPAGQQL